jgi:hypothetical protein
MPTAQGSIGVVDQNVGASAQLRDSGFLRRRDVVPVPDERLQDLHLRVHRPGSGLEGAEGPLDRRDRHSAHHADGAGRAHPGSDHAGQIAGLLEGEYQGDHVAGDLPSAAHHDGDVAEARTRTEGGILVLEAVREDEVVPGRGIREERLVELRRRAGLLVTHLRAEGVPEHHESLVGPGVPAGIAYRTGREQGRPKRRVGVRSTPAGIRFPTARQERHDAQGPDQARFPTHGSRSLRQMFQHRIAGDAGVVPSSPPLVPTIRSVPTAGDDDKTRASGKRDGA